MEKKILIILILVVLVIAIGVLFYLLKSGVEKEEIKIESESDILVWIDNQKLDSEKLNHVFLNSLRPKISIVDNKGAELSKVVIDETDDVINDKFFRGERKIRGNKLEFVLSYALRPYIHNLKVISRSGDLTFTKEFIFSIVAFDDFEREPSLSKFWVVPESTIINHPKNWYVVGRNLNIDAIEDGRPHASLAFLYPFSGDVTIDFYFSPKGENVSLISYFLESGFSFVLGNGDNKTIVLLSKDGNTVSSNKFSMIPGNLYHVRLVRDDTLYNLYIEPLDVVPKFENNWPSFSRKTPLITLEDKNKLNIDDHIGFTVWGGSDGITIDRVFISGIAVKE